MTLHIVKLAETEKYEERKKYLDKPHLRLDPTRPNTGKWECITVRVSFFGGIYIKQGKGYSPKEAYERWQRCH